MQFVPNFTDGLGFDISLEFVLENLAIIIGTNIFLIKSYMDFSCESSNIIGFLSAKTPWQAW